MSIVVRLSIALLCQSEVQPYQVWWGGICPGRSGGGVCDVCCGVCNRGGCVPAFGMLLRMGSLRPCRGGIVYGIHLCMRVLFCIV